MINNICSTFWTNSPTITHPPHNQNMLSSKNSPPKKKKPTSNAPPHWKANSPSRKNRNHPRGSSKQSINLNKKYRNPSKEATPLSARCKSDKRWPFPQLQYQFCKEHKPSADRDSVNILQIWYFFSNSAHQAKTGPRTQGIHQGDGPRLIRISAISWSRKPSPQ